MGNLCAASANENASEEVPKAKVKVTIHGLLPSSNAMGPILLAMHCQAGEMEMCNIMEGQNKTDKFLKMNPFHCIPTMEQDKFSLGESQAMMRYIAREFAPALYPSDPKLAARCDWALDALGTTVYNAWAERAYPILGFHDQPADIPKCNDKLKEVLEMFCDTFMTPDQPFICGDDLTIADFKALPFLYVLSHPALEKCAGVKLGPRLSMYLSKVMQAVSSSGMLLAGGGYAVKEMLDGKAKELPPFKGKVVECGIRGKSTVKAGPAKADETGAKIYGMPPSPNTAAAVILARDAKVGDFAMCNLMAGEHLKPDFIAKNAFHQIPTFEDSDGFSLGETNAMLRYIAVNYKPELYPPDDNQACGRIDWAMDVGSTSLFKKVAYGLFYPLWGFCPDPEDQNAANEAATTLLKEYEITFLNGNKFVCGQKLTIAEYKILPFLFAASQPGVEAKTGFKLSPRMATYMKESMQAMPNSNFMTEGFCIKSHAEDQWKKEAADKGKK